MGIKSWLWHLLNPDASGQYGTMTEVNSVIETGIKAYHQELAFWSCIRIIKNAVAMTQWRTDINGKPEKKMDHYRYNVRPNANQNAAEFFQVLVSRLLLYNEVLVIEDPTKSNGELLIADSFSKEERGITDWVFKDVTVSGKNFSDTFYMRDVLYLRNNLVDIHGLVKGISAGYTDLLEASAKYYKKARAQKIVLSNPFVRQGSPEEGEKLLLKKAKDWQQMMETENGFMMLEKGEDFKSLNVGDPETSRDMRGIIDDIYDFTANAFGISPTLLRGRVAGLEESMAYTMNFCIVPLVKMIEKEINAKRYTPKEYLAGTRTVADTSMVLNMTLKNLGQIGSQLISNGLYSTNELRSKFGEPLIDEPWADEYRITKNYENTKAQTAGKEVKADE